MYTAISLFSGIGGIDLAFALAGFDITAQVEIDPYCREVLKRHAGDYWPNAAQFTDVRAVGADELGEADVIFGGFPCQNISIAGKGAGLAGEQSGLWYEFRRIIGEVRPRFVFLENVPAITFRGGAEVVGHLAALGYDARWGIVAASDAGAPHQRSRWWCVGYRDGFGYDLSTDAGINGSALRQASPRTHDAAEPERTRPVWQQLAGDASGLGLQTRADFAASVREEPFADVAGTADGGDVDDANLYGYTPTNEYAVVRSSIGAGYVTSDVAQPRMGRAADGLPGGLHGTGGLNDKQVGSPQTGTTSSDEYGTVRDVRDDKWAVGEASRRLSEADRCNDPVSKVSRETRNGNGAAESKGHETMSDLRSGVHSLHTLSQPDMQQGLPERVGAQERIQTMAAVLINHQFPAGPGPQHPWEPPRQIVSRGPHWKHRIKALGNSVVPQCVYPFALEIRNMLEEGESR